MAEKTLMITYSDYVSPPPGSTVAHPISIHIGAKGLCRPHHRPKILVKGSKWGPIGGISILGCMVPTTCGQGQGRIKGVKGAKGSEQGAKGANAFLY